MDGPIRLQPTDAVRAEECFCTFLERVEPEHHATMTALAHGLGPIFQLSPHIFENARRHSATVVDCAQRGISVALDTALAPLGSHFEDRASLEKALRFAKQQAGLAVGLADLTGLWTANQVGEAMTLIADRTVHASIRFLLLDLNKRGKIALPNVDVPEQACGLTVLAMGKHGAGELNYSSDIDLIVIIDPEAVAVLDRSEAITVFTRLIKQFVAIMQERTGDGYVFRTDLRLRPDPGSMPLAVPLSLALRYYESRGQNWERAALIKARPIAGDPALGEEFLTALQPFLWRRYLDYAAIADIHSIKRQIQSHRDLTGLKVPGHNVKLGRGGIREIEFFVQTQQLIAGGRAPKLRGRKTLDMLQELAAQGWIEQSTCDAMTVHYRYLRDVEHRLQLIADAQTHTIPDGDDALLQVARLAHCKTVAQFERATRAHLADVETHYFDLFNTAEPLDDAGGNLSFTGDEFDPGTQLALKSLGFARPDFVIKTVKTWHYGRSAAMQSVEAREHLTEFTPALLRALASTGDADEAFLRFDQFLVGLPAGFQLFSLLRSNPELLALLVRILGTAPAMAGTITKRPHVFDGLLEPGMLRRQPDRAVHAAALSKTLSLALRYEDGLERLRIYAAEQRFLIGTRILSGALPAASAGEQFSDLAEAVMDAAVNWVRVPFEADHGRVPDSQFGILALGNLGSRTLTATSDLDLILLYRFEPSQDTSDGPKPLHASQYYGRFAQRLIAALSAPTAEGIAYETDFRLRPHGQKGPIASSLRAFDLYYQNEAWTWELLALARGRPVFGTGSFQTDMKATVSAALQSHRDLKTTVKDVLEMRGILLKEHPPTSVFDVKRVAGGLTDLDFIDQLQRLIHDDENEADFAAPELKIANMTLVEVRSNYLVVQQMVRLCLGTAGPSEEWPDGFRREILKALDLPDLKTARAYLKDMQSAVHSHFQTTLRRLGGVN